MRLLVFLGVLVLILTGCTGGSVSIPFGPVSFRVAADGAVSVAIGPTFVTPMGDFKVGVVVPLLEGRGEDRYWYIVIRRTIAGEARETIYQLDSDAALRVESNGQIVEEFSRHRVQIEVPPGGEAQIDVTDINNQEISKKEGRVYLLPADFVGTWTGEMIGSDRQRWSNAPDEYWPGTWARLTLYGGEVGHPVGEFRYDSWDCSGVVTFLSSYRDAAGYLQVSLQHVVLDGGYSQRCGGFIQTGIGDPNHGGLTLRLVDGVLRADTDLVPPPHGREHSVSYDVGIVGEIEQAAQYLAGAADA